MARNKKSNKGSKEPRNYSAEEDRMILMEVLRTSPANLEEMQFWGDLAGRFDGKLGSKLQLRAHWMEKLDSDLRSWIIKRVPVPPLTAFGEIVEGMTPYEKLKVMSLRLRAVRDSILSLKSDKAFAEKALKGIASEGSNKVAALQNETGKEFEMQIVLPKRVVCEGTPLFNGQTFYLYPSQSHDVCAGQAYMLEYEIKRHGGNLVWKPDCGSDNVINILLGGNMKAAQEFCVPRKLSLFYPELITICVFENRCITHHDFANNAVYLKGKAANFADPNGIPRKPTSKEFDLLFKLVGMIYETDIQGLAQC